MGTSMWEPARAEVAWHCTGKAVSFLYNSICSIYLASAYARPACHLLYVYILPLILKTLKLIGQLFLFDEKLRLREKRILPAAELRFEPDVPTVGHTPCAAHDAAVVLSDGRQCQRAKKQTDDGSIFLSIGRLTISHFPPFCSPQLKDSLSLLVLRRIRRQKNEKQRVSRS